MSVDGLPTWSQVAFRFVGGLVLCVVSAVRLFKALVEEDDLA